ncbi:MAG: hypothetical protein R3E12_12760 [Candidatus Eisenbacteria bacterium]
MLILPLRPVRPITTNTRGVVTIAESEEKRQQTLAEYQEEVALQAEDRRRGAEAFETILDRNALIEQAKQIDERIKIEHQQIQD